MSTAQAGNRYVSFRRHSPPSVGIDIYPPQKVFENFFKICVAASSAVKFFGLIKPLGRATLFKLWLELVPKIQHCRPLGEADAFKLRRIRLLSGGLATEGQTLQAARQSHLLRAMVDHQAKGPVLQAA